VRAQALRFDLDAVKTFGFNTVRLHQKARRLCAGRGSRPRRPPARTQVNPERWYYHADRLGILVLQDAVQKYGNANEDTIAPFLNDLYRMMDGAFPPQRQLQPQRQSTS
jgi:hypothetical protein